MKYLIIFLLNINTISLLYSQSLFNHVNEYGLARSSTGMLCETDSSYLAIGYSQDTTNTSFIGVYVADHDKIDGHVKNVAYYKRLGEEMYIAGRSKNYRVGDEVQFAVGASQYLYKLGYNIKTNTISALDTITNQDSSVFYIYDMYLRHDTTVYLAGMINFTYNTADLGIIYSYPDNTQKIIKLQPTEDNFFIGGRLHFMANGHIIVFGNYVPKIFTPKDVLVVTELDQNHEIVKQFESPVVHQVWRTTDAIVENDSIAYILCKGNGIDMALGESAYPSFLFKFDLKTFKIVWKRSREKPATRSSSYPSQLVKGHKDGEYLYCTDANGVGLTDTFYYSVGRVVKVNTNGEIVWYKDYTYLPNNNNDNNATSSLLATADGHYLLGGDDYSNGQINSWLVKIDEDGNIVPIDTTSATTQPIRDLPDITIYPNPAHDYIIINQGEQSDMRYSIYDAQGRIALSQTVAEPHQNMIWDISALTSGMYVLSISHKGQIVKSVQLVVL